MTKTTMLTTLSEQLKEHAAEFAARNGTSLAEVVRLALSEYTQYDMKAEKDSFVETRGRPRKYATAAEAQEAARQRTRDRDALNRALLQDHQKQQQIAAAKALRDSLGRVGRSEDRK